MLSCRFEQLYIAMKKYRDNDGTKTVIIHNIIVKFVIIYVTMYRVDI